MDLVGLTQWDGTKIWVNIDKIVTICEFQPPEAAGYMGCKTTLIADGQNIVYAMEPVNQIIGTIKELILAREGR